jgi:hypothetical protein
MYRRFCEDIKAYETLFENQYEKQRIREGIIAEQDFERGIDVK